MQQLEAFPHPKAKAKAGKEGEPEKKKPKGKGRGRGGGKGRGKGGGKGRGKGKGKAKVEKKVKGTGKGDGAKAKAKARAKSKGSPKSNKTAAKANIFMPSSPTLANKRTPLNHFVDFAVIKGKFLKKVYLMFFVGTILELLQAALGEREEPQHDRVFRFLLHVGLGLLGTV